MYAYFLLRRKRKPRHQDASKRIRKQTIVLTLWGHMSECSPLLCRHTTRHHTGGEQATSSPIRYNPYCAVFSIHTITIDETTHLKYRAFVKNGTKVKHRQWWEGVQLVSLSTVPVLIRCFVWRESLAGNHHVSETLLALTRKTKPRFDSFDNCWVAGSTRFGVNDSASPTAHSNSDN